MNNTLLYAFTVLLLFASGGMAALGIFRQRIAPQWLYRTAVAGGLLGGGHLLWNMLFQGDGLHFGVLIGLVCVGWLAALVAFLEGFVNRVLVLDMVVFPACALVFVLSGVLVLEPPIRMAGSALFQFHLLIALAAYGLLGIAAVHALIMACQERMLHNPMTRSVGQRKLHERFLDQLPPLMRMDAILFRQLWAGFVLLTLTLITGFLFSEHWLGVAGQFNHKTVFAVLSWVSFAVLLVGRLWKGWRGKVALRWCLGSYCVLLLAYFGTQFVLEFVLKRTV
jgi:ABC-type uncharacterized transport system permease subunit